MMPVTPPTAAPLTRQAQAALLALILLALAARALPGPRTIDDAFITFRYSRNIVEGLGFVYNPGVQTLGTTTPLYTLLMAAISAVSGGQDFPTYALLVNALADAASAALLYLIARRISGSSGLAIIPAALWAVSPVSVTFAVGGMETSLVICWMLAAFWLHLTGRDRLLGLAAALGFLTRIDALLWIGPILLFQLGERWWTRRDHPLLARLPLATWAVFGLALLPWLLFSAVYFGSPVPNSLSSKSAAYIMPAGSALATLAGWLLTPFNEESLLPLPGLALLGLGYLALLPLGIVSAGRRLPRLLPLLLYPPLYVAAFAVINPLIFRWYTAPPLPGLMLTLFAGALALSAAVSQRARAPRLTAALMGALGLFWLLSSLGGWTLQPDHGPQRPAPRSAWHQIELLYRDMAETLVSTYGVTPQTRVASGDIGAVGYFSRAVIVDTVGLVTPEIRQYYPIPPELIVPGQNYAIPPQLIFDTQPDYLVTMEAFVRLGLERDPRFGEQYALLRDIPTDFYGTGMRLYGRKTR